MTRKVMLRKAPRKVPLESDEQILFVTWLHKKGFRCNHSPNGGKRSLSEGAKFKRMGVSKGYPDIEVPFSSGSYHGLYIEFKPIKGGKLTFEQKDWLIYLREKGYFAEVAHGFEEAKQIFLHYLSLTPKAA